ncbi:hypothetical protein HK105_201066 [Polyrhizophydium stewartii]|uniref:Uncharacterized protein n=1 Tax=Polyrhizophydium stewartii TaxID=2732419 RepID=A0ABR4NIU0_9FUNG|nr:hypothetical protein HK105_006490 [Polyrhizophydium stewartii]
MTVPADTPGAQPQEGTPEQHVLTKKERLMIEQSRRRVDAMFGPGAYERGRARIKPHRCARHLDDVMHGINHLEFGKPVWAFLRCMASTPGSEPPRVYSDSPVFDLASLAPSTPPAAPPPTAAKGEKDSTK